jgi:hypothetical protein
MELSLGPKTRRKSAGAKWRRQADWQSSKPKHIGAKMFLKSHSISQVQLFKFVTYLTIKFVTYLTKELPFCNVSAQKSIKISYSSS